MSARRRPGRWKVWTRTIHIYASLLGLVLTSFFGVTGFVLNHEEWFAAETVQRTAEAELPDAVRVELEPLQVVEAVRAEFSLSGRLSAYEVDPAELRLRFERPGEISDVLIVLPSGHVELDQERYGAWSALTDLHTGERSGDLGRRLIDATAILLLTISISGFVLWLTLPKRRRAGLAALVVAGGLTLVALGYLFA